MSAHGMLRTVAWTALCQALEADGHPVPAAAGPALARFIDEVATASLPYAHIVTKLPLPEGQGWVRNTGEQPLNVDGPLELRFRNGKTHPAGQHLWVWCLYGGDYDIIAYRVIKEPQA